MTPPGCHSRPRSQRAHDDVRLQLAREPHLGHTAEGETTTFGYDAYNHLTSVTEPGKPAETYARNTLGDLLRVTTPEGHTTSFGYDANGALTKVTDPALNVWRIQRDGMERPTAYVDPLLNRTEIAYDGNLNPVSVTDRRAKTTTYSYDLANRLTQVDPPATGSWQFGYDARGNRDQLTDPRGEITTYDYDLADRMVAVTEPLATRTTYDYDAAGNLTQITDPRGNSTSFAYDALGRLAEITQPLGKVTSFGYDPVRNLISRTTAEDALTLAYDDANRLTQITDGTNMLRSFAYDDAGRLTGATDAQQKTIQLGWDDDDRLTSIDDSRGQTAARSYDSRGNLTTQTDGRGTLGFVYDELNRMTQLTDPQSQAIGFDYDPEGNLTKTTLPNGIVTTNAYDGVGRMLRTSSERQGTILQSFDYAYGSAGNRTSQTDRNNEVTTYTYDALSRLTELDPPADPPVAYAYDAAGNRTEADGVTYTYNALNQLTGDSTGTSYVYDRAGRLVERRDGSQTTTYTRDALDQLIRVDDGSNPIAYSYDALGRRSERTEGGATESAHYGDLTDAPILDTDASGIIESYVRGAAGLVEQRAGATRFPLSDAHGDVTAIADTDGTVASRHSYDPWGEQLSGHELQFGWLGAIGLRTDSAAALSQMGVRSYVPGLGRFATEDPIIGYYGVGQSVNRFTYVWNDPVNRYDPMGLGPCVLGFIGCDEADDPCDSLLSGPMLPLCLVPGSAEDDFVNASAGFGDGLTSNPLSSLGIGPNVSVTRTLRDDILDKPGNIDYDSEAYGLGNVAGDAGRFGLGATYRWYKYRPRPNEWPVEHPPRDLDPLP